MTFQLFLNRLIHELRACPHCQEIWDPVDILCPACHKLLVPEPGELDFGFYSVIYPFLWRSLKEPVASVLYHQKGGLELSSSLVLAQFVLQARLAHGPLPRGPLSFIPVPPSEYGQLDHADCLARALAQLTQGKFYRLLCREGGQGRQKQKDLAQRADLKIFSLESDPHLLGRIVLVDDVVTTGSTVRACYHALGRPEALEVWSLAHRKLQGNK